MGSCLSPHPHPPPPAGLSASPPTLTQLVLNLHCQVVGVHDDPVFGRRLHWSHHCEGEKQPVVPHAQGSAHAALFPGTSPPPPHPRYAPDTCIRTSTSNPGISSSPTPKAGSAGPPGAPEGPQLPPSKQALPPNAVWDLLPSADPSGCPAPTRLAPRCLSLSFAERKSECP